MTKTGNATKTPEAKTSTETPARKKLTLSRETVKTLHVRSSIRAGGDPSPASRVQSCDPTQIG